MILRKEVMRVKPAAKKTGMEKPQKEPVCRPLMKNKYRDERDEGEEREDIRLGEVLVEATHGIREHTNSVRQALRSLSYGANMFVESESYRTKCPDSGWPRIAWQSCDCSTVPR
jgi:hypothetical protein